MSKYFIPEIGLTFISNNLQWFEKEMTRTIFLRAIFFVAKKFKQNNVAENGWYC